MFNLSSSLLNKQKAVGVFHDKQQVKVQDI